MKIIAIGVLVQLLADMVVGARLLWLAARTRRLPELCLGLCCFLMGAVGVPLAMAVRAGLVGGPSSFGLWLATAIAVQNVACGALVIGTWRVFRPSSAAAAALAFALLTPLVISVPGSAGDAGFWYWLGLAGRSGAFLWSFLESVRYAAMLTRRQRLGLGDPVVTDRFRLWAICCAGVLIGFAATVVVKAQGHNPGEVAWYLGLVSVVGLIAGVTLWLAFAPPAFYLRRFDSGGSAA